MFVEAQVIRQLARANARQGQPVRLGGSVRNEEITYVYRSAPTGQPGDGIRGVSPISPVPLTSDDVLRNMEMIDVFAMGTRQDATRVPPSVIWGIRNELFGNERVADIWNDRIRLYALHGRRELNLDHLLIHAVATTRDGTGGRFELSVRAQDPTGFWLQLHDGMGCPFAAVLPSDKHQSARYLIEFGVGDAMGGKTEIKHFSASLGSNNSKLLAQAVEIWRRYQVADFAGAVDEFETGQLRQTVREKIDSPLAATVAALVLLRADRIDLLQNWLENLSNWFPEMSDPPVLRAWQLAHTESQRLLTLQNVTNWLAQLEPRGLCVVQRRDSLMLRHSQTDC